LCNFTHALTGIPRASIEAIELSAAQMDSTFWIAFWAAMFVGTHLALSSSAMRPRLVAAVGEQAYRGIYSLVAFATLGPLIYEFARHKHAGSILWYLRADAPMRWLAWLLMLAALIFFVASFINPNPGGIGAPTATAEPRGILKITRHPGFIGFILFGLAHMLMNGWAGDVIFFAMFPVIGILGAVHQDQRRIRDLGARYRDFVAKTSFMPFAALVSGRQRWTAADTPWAAIGAGAIVTLAIVALHALIFGGHPLGWSIF
jgi:uncharacterized membrane protein